MSYYKATYGQFICHQRILNVVDITRYEIKKWRYLYLIIYLYLQDKGMHKYRIKKRNNYNTYDVNNNFVNSNMYKLEHPNIV